MFGDDVSTNRIGSSKIYTKWYSLAQSKSYTKYFTLFIIFVLDEVEDEREVDGVKGNLKRVIVRNFDREVDEGKLLSFSYSFPPIC